MFCSYKMLAWAVRAGTRVAALVPVLTSNVTGTELKDKTQPFKAISLSIFLSWYECTAMLTSSLSNTPVLLILQSVFFPPFKHWKVQPPSMSRDGAWNEHGWVRRPPINHRGGKKNHRPGSTWRVWHHHHKLLTNDVKVRLQIRTVMIPSAQKRNTSIGL